MAAHTTDFGCSPTLNNSEAFYQGVVAAMLFAEMDDDDQPLDANHTEDDLSDTARCQLKNECRRFLYAANSKVSGLVLLPMDTTDFTQAGHDFWFTRQGHGTGFWDKADIYGEEPARILTAMAGCFGECWPAVGDDGKIYLE